MTEVKLYAENEAFKILYDEHRILKSIVDRWPDGHYDDRKKIRLEKLKQIKSAMELIKREYQLPNIKP